MERSVLLTWRRAPFARPNLTVTSASRNSLSTGLIASKAAAFTCFCTTCMMVLRSSAWSLPGEKGILMMLLTPCGVDFVNTLLYHLEALQLSFFSFFLSSLTLSEGYNTIFEKLVHITRSKLCYIEPTT